MGVSNLIIKPTTVSLLTTYQCTASCKNCCFKCSPSYSSRMTLEQMKKYVDQCLFYYKDSIKVLVLTGGECFLLGEDLLSIIEYATNSGLIVRVVTNGYWATSLEKAHSVLNRLQMAGLKEINFSTGDDHQKWVPYDNVVYGSIAAIDNQLTCLINVETHDQASFQSKSFYEDNRLKDYFSLKRPNHLMISNGVWMPFVHTNDNDIKYDNIKLDDCEIKGCHSLFSTIAINPYANMLACCGLTCEYIPFLRLGNVEKQSIKELYERQFSDFLKIWLYTEGPYAILEYIYRKRGLVFSIKGHICSICAELFKDRKNIQCMMDNCNEVAPSVLFKYNMLLKTKISN